ncbi:MAG: flagellar basal body rod protein FlgF [Pseudomonadota bacterium]|nr:flagellar basal body rod protein FlgF [Pseudomonadota bacterium]
MSTVLQVAAAASRQVANAQAAVTHNLANAGTTAFKADLFYAEQGYVNRGEVGASAVDFRAGNMAYTGRDLDIAIAGDGWMQVITPAGEEILSRRGDLRIDPNGNLIDAEQNQILGDGGPINVPADSQVTIGADGTVSFIPRGETALGTVVIGRILLVNPAPETLIKGLDGNIRTEGQVNLEPAADVQLAVGALETSNVNPIASMVQMIELSRSFEGHIQTMKSTDELDASSASLMRLE